MIHSNQTLLIFQERKSLKKILRIFGLLMVSCIIGFWLYQFPYKKYITLHYFYNDLAKLHVKKEDIEIESIAKYINTPGWPYNIRFTVKQSPYLYYYMYDFVNKEQPRLSVYTGEAEFYTDEIIYEKKE